MTTPTPLPPGLEIILEKIEKIGADSNARRRDDPPPNQDVAARTLLDNCERMAADECTFFPKELLVPRRDSTWRQSLGVVCVLRRLTPAREHIDWDCRDYYRCDLVVLAMRGNGCMSEIAVNSREFERYTGPVVAP